MADFFKPMFRPGSNAQWVLKRMDDNGNVFEVESFEVYYLANKKKEEYEAKGHKQTYFIEKL